MGQENRYLQALNQAVTLEIDGVDPGPLRREGTAWSPTTAPADRHI